MNPWGAALIQRIRELEDDVTRRAASACESAFAIDAARAAIRAGAPTENILAALSHAYTIFDPDDPAYDRLPRCPTCKDKPDHDSIYHPAETCRTCHGTGADTRPTLLELARTLRDRCTEHLAACNTDPGGERQYHPHLADLAHTLDDYLTSNTPLPPSTALLARMGAAPDPMIDDIPF